MDTCRGAHHTAFSYDLTAEQMGDWAAAMILKLFILIKIQISENKNELRWNNVSFNYILLKEGFFLINNSVIKKESNSRWKNNTWY